MSVKNATNSSAYHFYEFLDLVWMTNLFNASANGAGAPNGVDVTLDLPIEGGPINLPNGSGDFSSSILSQDFGGAATFKIRFKGNYTNTNAVRGYPACILGSRVGGNESFGVATGRTVKLMEGVRNNASGDGGSFEIRDLEICQQETGYPQFAGSLPSSTIIVEAVDTGSAAARNIFTDTYWHDVSNIHLLPTSDTLGQNHITALKDSINGISGRDTAMWNLNFWHGGPSGFQGTGGNRVASDLEIETGKPVDIWVKHETGGRNNFFYLAFVFKPEQLNHQLNYNVYADWVMDPDAGPGTFLTEVYERAESAAIISAMANPTNGAVAKNVRPPDAQMVVDSLQIGCEMWGTESGGEAEITFERIGFLVDSRPYGIVEADEADEADEAGKIGSSEVRWLLPPETASGAAGTVITRSGIRQNLIENSESISITVSEGSRQPELSDFRYDWPTDTITATIQESGSVPLRIYRSGSSDILDTIDWAIDVS